MMLNNPNFQTINMYNLAEQFAENDPVQRMMGSVLKMVMICPSEMGKVFLCPFCDSVGGKPCPSAPVNILNHLTPANQ